MISALLAFQLSLQNQLDAAVQQFRKEKQAVGISASVIRGGQEWTFESGMADREKAKPVTRRTLFRLASVSKPVTATAVMSLVSEGRIDLDKGVSAYVPSFDDRGGQVTLRRVLTHTSGIRHYVDGKEDEYYRPFSTQEALDVFAKDPLLFAPGEKLSYSTHAYTLPVAAIESVSKQSLASFIRSRIAAKSGPSLACEVRAESKPERSSLYGKVGTLTPRYEKAEDLSWKFGGGGMESNALDLARFGREVMAGRLLAPRWRDRMWERQKLNSGEVLPRGLGWGMPADGSITHSGSQQGSSTYMVVLPQKQLVIVVLCNTDGIRAQELADKMRTLLPN